MESAVAQYVGYLKQTVAPQMYEQLAVVVQKFLATRSDADLNRWAKAVDLTATRAGYLICGDLEIAARIAQGESVTVGSPEPKEKVMDLILWSLSDEYFALREHLGQTIG